MHHWALNGADGVGGQGWEHRDHGQWRVSNQQPGMGLMSVITCDHYCGLRDMTLMPQSDNGPLQTTKSITHSTITSDHISPHIDSIHYSENV